MIENEVHIIHVFFFFVVVGRQSFDFNEQQAQEIFRLFLKSQTETHTQTKRYTLTDKGIFKNCHTLH